MPISRAANATSPSEEKQFSQSAVVARGWQKGKGGRGSKRSNQDIKRMQRLAPAPTDSPSATSTQANGRQRKRQLQRKPPTHRRARVRVQVRLYETTSTENTKSPKPSAHHGARVVELAAVVGRREERDELPLREELVAVLDDLRAERRNAWVCSAIAAIIVPSTQTRHKAEHSLLFTSRASSMQRVLAIQ